MTPHKHIIALSNEFLTPTQEFMLLTREFIKNEWSPHISNLTAMMSQLMKFCLTIYQYYYILIIRMPMGPPPWHLDLVLMSNKTRWVGETWNDTENGAMVTSCVT